MNRNDAAQYLRKRLDENGLTDWKMRISAVNAEYLGLCSYKDKTIFINAHHIDQHPDIEVQDTINHEVAHALVPNAGHNEIWKEKARELGAAPRECASYALSDLAIDAIRSGASIEIGFEEEIIRKPTFKVTRLQEKCPFCGKVAKESRFKDIGGKRWTWLECGHMVTKELPKGIPYQNIVSEDGKTLYDFQVSGAHFIDGAFGRALICDEMGLGKTVQALAWLKYHPEAFPVLFVVKSAIKYQWMKEVMRWIGDDHFGQIISNGKGGIIPGLKTYVISYDLLRRFDTSKIKQIGIKTVILDEVQAIKNPDSTRTQEVRTLVKEIPNIIALSGTPWKNRGSEFFTILNILNPVKFWSYQYFIRNWVDTYYDGNRLKEGGIANPAKFKEYVKDFVIRRERSEVMKELPSISRNRLTTEIDAVNKTAYDAEVSDFVKFWNQRVIDGEEDSFESNQHALARLTRMRHILGLAKIPATMNFVEEFIEETDRKLVIFVHHKDVGEIIYRKLQAMKLDFPIYKLTAELNSEERFLMQEKFNSEKRSIMVASTLASGEGLNLQSCTDCIMHERQWNPANEEQAEGRFIRLGREAYGLSSSDPVTATYVHAEGSNSVDILFDKIVEEKRRNFHSVMNKGMIPQWNETSLIKELGNMLSRS